MRLKSVIRNLLLFTGTAANSTNQNPGLRPRDYNNNEAMRLRDVKRKVLLFT